MGPKREVQIIPIEQNPVVLLEVETHGSGLKGVRAKRDTKGDLDKGNHRCKDGKAGSEINERVGMVQRHWRDRSGAGCLRVSATGIQGCIALHCGAILHSVGFYQHP